MKYNINRKEKGEEASVHTANAMHLMSMAVYCIPLSARRNVSYHLC